MAERKLEVKIVGDSRSLERAFRRSAKSSDSFGKRITKGAGKGLLLLGGGAAAAAAAGVAGVSIGLVKSARAAAEAEASNARLSAQLKTLGKNNAQVKGNIDKTVQSLSMMSGFDDEDLQDAFTQLVRSSGNVAKSQKDLSLITDMAASGQVNLTTATKLVNRVNNGSVTSLKRYGIAVDENTTKEEALALLRKKFAGQAEAYGKTAAGAQARLGVAVENAFEQIGVALTPLIVQFTDIAVKYLPGIAKSVSLYVGQAVAWLKANWPQIQAVLKSVWDWYKTYVQSVVVPAFKAVATGIGALIGFVKLHMPEIKAAVSAVFGWISTNIVPTVRTVANAVAAIVRGMATVWREHGNDIKAIIGPVFQTIKTVIVNALKIIKGVIEIALALIRGDWSKAWSSFKTVVSTAIDSVLTILLTAPRMMFAAAKIIGREMVEGVKAGLSAAKDALVQKFKSVLGDAMKSAKEFLGINSPSKTTMAELGFPMIEGIAYGLGKKSGALKATLSGVLRDAVSSARGNLGNLTGNLAGMLGKINAAQISGMTSTGSITGGKTLAQIRAEQARVQRARDKARLEEAVANAETDDDRKQAQQDLDDWLIDEEARVLEESMQQKERNYDEEIGALQDSFDRGLISADTFKTELDKIIGANTGTELGTNFAAAFGQQLTAVMQQIQTLASYAGIGLGAPGVENPAGAVTEALRTSNEDRFNDAWEKWDKRRAARRDALESAKEKDAKGKTVKKYTAQEVDRLMATWRENNPEPKRSAFGLAKGGILRKTVFAAGEAGPEALIPLGSSKAKSMLADAVASAGGGGAATVINVTVNGNEFSAREFADKLAPELRRRVAMTRSA